MTLCLVEFSCLFWILHSVQVKQDGFFPADLLFLASTNPDGVCYIEVFDLIFFIFQNLLIVFTILKSIWFWNLVKWECLISAGTDHGS